MRIHIAVGALRSAAAVALASDRFRERECSIEIVALDGLDRSVRVRCQEERADMALLVDAEVDVSGVALLDAHVLEAFLSPLSARSRVTVEVGAGICLVTCDGFHLRVSQDSNHVFLPPLGSPQGWSASVECGGLHQLAAAAQAIVAGPSEIAAFDAVYVVPSNGQLRILATDGRVLLDGRLGIVETTGGPERGVSIDPATFAWAVRSLATTGAAVSVTETETGLAVISDRGTIHLGPARGEFPSADGVLAMSFANGVAVDRDDFACALRAASNPHHPAIAIAIEGGQLEVSSSADGTSVSACVPGRATGQFASSRILFTPALALRAVMALAEGEIRFRYGGALDAVELSDSKVARVILMPLRDDSVGHQSARSATA